MSRHPFVIVVGSVMQDLTFVCADFPASGQTIMARLAIGQGGKGSNQAIACGNCGVPTTFVGATGADGFAEQVRAFYRKHRIGCEIAVKQESATGTAVILINREGQNQIVVEPGANLRLHARDVPRTLWSNARVLVVQLESNQETTAQVLRTARRGGVTTLLNPAPMRADFDPGLLRYVDILVPNESEFVELVRRQSPSGLHGFSEVRLHGLAPEELHDLCRTFPVATVIITLGRRGCFISEKSGFRFIAAHRGMKVVDMTGAGDAFCGGLAAGLVRFGGRVFEASLLGNAVAALSITKPGTAYAMPSLADVRRFLKQKKVPLELK